MKLVLLADVRSQVAILDEITGDWSCDRTQSVVFEVFCIFLLRARRLYVLTKPLYQG
jgi:hypothetical protein